MKSIIDSYLFNLSPNILDKYKRGQRCTRHSWFGCALILPTISVKYNKLLVPASSWAKYEKWLFLTFILVSVVLFSLFSKHTNVICESLPSQCQPKCVFASVCPSKVHQTCARPGHVPSVSLYTHAHQLIDQFPFFSPRVCMTCVLWFAGFPSCALCPHNYQFNLYSFFAFQMVSNYLVTFVHDFQYPRTLFSDLPISISVVALISFSVLSVCVI